VRLKVEFSYLGENYFGYQVQDGVRTVQGEIEKVLSDFFDTDISFVASGRTDTGVSAIRQVGHFDINDDVFAEHSWYFRNSLVRANYKNFEKNIFEDISFLEKFFYNLLAKTNFELKNRYTHINYEQSANDTNSKCNDCTLE